MLFAFVIPQNWEGPLALIVWAVTGAGGVAFWYFKIRKTKAIDDIEIGGKRSKMTEAQKDRQVKRDRAVSDHQAGQSQAMFERALQAYEEALEDERSASSRREQALMERMDARDKQHADAMRLIHADHTNCQRELAKLTERVATLEDQQSKGASHDRAAAD